MRKLPCGNCLHILIPLSKAHMSQNSIPAYIYAPVPTKPNHNGAGLFPETGVLKPVAAFGYVFEVLDIITAAAEAGILTTNTWVAQVFADKNVFREFIQELRSYDESHRIHDRWHAALMRLVGTVDECGFVTSSEIAERLVEQAKATQQV